MKSFHTIHMCWIMTSSPMNSTTVSMQIAQNFSLQQTFPTTKFQGHKYNYIFQFFWILYSYLKFKMSKVELTISLSTLPLSYFPKLSKWHHYFLCCPNKKPEEILHFSLTFIALHLIHKWRQLIYISIINKCFLLSIHLTNYLSSFFTWFFFFLCSRLISDHTISTYSHLISLSLWLE